MANMPPKLDSIKNTLLRLHQAGYYISESALRGWVRTGQLRSISCGRKSLIFFEDVVTFLENYAMPLSQDSTASTTP